MIECLFEVETETAHGKIYRCVDCGHLCPVPLQKPPRRKCRRPRREDQCPYRSAFITSIPGDAVNCGCGIVPLFECSMYLEPVTPQNVNSVQAIRNWSVQTSKFTGRNCSECEQLPLKGPGTKRNRFVLPDSHKLATGDDCGLVTGAKAIHWPCLGANALAAARLGLGMAVADHGLRPWQRDELDKLGVWWLDHEKPDLSEAKSKHRIPSDIQAWWKPWVCDASPFKKTLWVDSDAVLCGDPRPAFQRAGDGACVASQLLWENPSEHLYGDTVRMVLGSKPLNFLKKYAYLNTGVICWEAGDPIISQWKQWCIKLMSMPEVLSTIKVRDQTAMLINMLNCHTNGEVGFQFLPEAYNVPADHLPAKQSMYRQMVSLDPEELLFQTTSRHPTAIVVHWIGGVKPWKIKTLRWDGQKIRVDRGTRPKAG